jgi:ATP-dependent DNA helicase RecG
MNEEILEQTLRLGEDSVTEFKGVIKSNYKVDRSDMAKAITALANTRGGHVFIGVEDDGTPTGVGTVEQADDLMRQITQICQDVIEPPLLCNVVKREVRGVPILVVEVPFSPNRPHRATGTYYVRDANRSRPALREDLVKLLQSTDYHFDEQPVAGATLDELDRDAVRAFLSSAYPGRTSEQHITPLLGSLKCIDRTGVPTVTGVLMFGREPTRWLVDARISAVRIPGTEVSRTFLDKQEIEGRVLDQLDAASAFIQRNVAAPSHVEGLMRVEGGIPLDVVREAITNAVLHRDYRIASQTRLLVFDDRIEVINPGNLLNQLTLENIRVGGISQKRNPVLASVLNKARRSESLGFGVPDMIRRMKDLGFREPSIEVLGGHFKLILWTTRSTGA